MCSDVEHLPICCLLGPFLLSSLVNYLSSFSYTQILKNYLQLVLTIREFCTFKFSYLLKFTCDPKLVLTCFHDHSQTCAEWWNFYSDMHVPSWGWQADALPFLFQLARYKQVSFLWYIWCHVCHIFVLWVGDFAVWNGTKHSAEMLSTCSWAQEAFIRSALLRK